MSMFNDTITHYHWNGTAYIRSIITNVYWDDVKQSNILRTGQVQMDSVRLIIPTIFPIDFTLSKDIVVKGAIDDEIDCTSQQTISAGIKQLKASYKHVVTVNVVDEKLFGGLKHLEVSCK